MLPEELRLVARLPCGDCAGSGQRATGRDATAGRRFPALYDDTCAPCDGRGYTEAEVTLDELRDLVNEWISNPLIAAGELDAVVDTLKKSMTAAALNSQGLADPEGVGSWLRACQEAAEALRSVAELRPRPRA